MYYVEYEILNSIVYIQKKLMQVRSTLYIYVISISILLSLYYFRVNIFSKLKRNRLPKSYYLMLTEQKGINCNGRYIFVLNCLTKYLLLFPLFVDNWNTKRCFCSFAALHCFICRFTYTLLNMPKTYDAMIQNIRTL